MEKRLSSILDTVVLEAPALGCKPDYAAQGVNLSPIS